MATFRDKHPVEAVQILPADFNGTNWDGNPFSGMLEWLVEAASNGVVSVFRVAEADYCEWKVEENLTYVSTIAQIGDWIVRNANGGLSVYIYG